MGVKERCRISEERFDGFQRDATVRAATCGYAPGVRRASGATRGEVL
jgi:hypothetical protein